MTEPAPMQQAGLPATRMPATSRDNAGTAVSRAGEQQAGTKIAMRNAVSALVDALGVLDGIYVATRESLLSRDDPDIGPFQLPRMAVATELKRLRTLSGLSRADLGRALGVSGTTVYKIELGKARVSEERLLAWERVTRSATGNVPSARVSDAAAQALAAAGRQLAQAENARVEALNRLVDAADFAVHAGLPASDVYSLLPAEPAQDGALSTVARVVDAAARRTAIPVPAEFWPVDLRARAAKCAGGHETAALIWTAARSLLPDGHALCGELDEMVTSLRTAARTGQYVTPDGHLLPLLGAEPHTVAAARQEGDLSQSAGRTVHVGFPVANPLAQHGHATAEPMRPPRAAGTVAAADAARGRGR